MGMNLGKKKTVTARKYEVLYDTSSHICALILWEVFRCDIQFHAQERETKTSPTAPCMGCSSIMATTSDEWTFSCNNESEY